MVHNGNTGQEWELQDHDSDLDNANNGYDDEEPEKHEKVEDGPGWKKYSESRLICESR